MCNTGTGPAAPTHRHQQHRRLGLLQCSQHWANAALLPHHHACSSSWWRYQWRSRSLSGPSHSRRRGACSSATCTAVGAIHFRRVLQLPCRRRGVLRLQRPQNGRAADTPTGSADAGTSAAHRRCCTALASNAAAAAATAVAAASSCTSAAPAAVVAAGVAVTWVIATAATAAVPQRAAIGQEVHPVQRAHLHLHINPNCAIRLAVSVPYLTRFPRRTLLWPPQPHFVAGMLLLLLLPRILPLRLRAAAAAGAAAAACGYEGAVGRHIGRRQCPCARVDVRDHHAGGAGHGRSHCTLQGTHMGRRQVSGVHRFDPLPSCFPNAIPSHVHAHLALAR